MTPEHAALVAALPALERLEELAAQCIDESVSGILIEAKELAQLIQCAFMRLDQEAFDHEAALAAPALPGATPLGEWVEQEIAKIEDDERFHYPPANTDVNAPLALIQLHMESRMEVLEKVREFLATLVPELEGRTE